MTEWCGMRRCRNEQYGSRTDKGTCDCDVLAWNSDRRHVACLGGSTRCEREDVA